MELFSLAGKTAIVTGACGLIGKNHCEALAEAGAKVIVADLDEAAAIEAAKKLGDKHMGIGLDVANDLSVMEAKEAVMVRYGKIDILVNNAAINDMFENPSAALELSKFENYPLTLWKKSLEVNITGVFLCSQIFGSVMADAKSGSIINIASTYGLTAPDQRLYRNENGEQTFYKSASYPTTKGAVISFTRFLAAYWGDKGVRVNTLSPGGVENGQQEFFKKNYSHRTPLGRMAQPTDYKGAIVFLASEASSYMTGANLVVDGGWTII
ncbi:MAG: SDR family oxidoreductase [Flammeovirgaceae bacterium]|jgi:NAD(P)-dependent dehydrogenase (short-subunit alcohol dehydrogenase family)|nr:SDR family oxidoreductase [Flammeovirgaceae bacterium]